MKTLGILYASTEGHTVAIGQEIRAVAERQGYNVDLIHIAHVPENFHAELYDGLVLAASIHMGSYQKAMVRFVQEHLDALKVTPAAFVSVCLTAAVEDEEHREIVEGYIKAFQEQTGWHPEHIESVAGALLYTEYGVLKRWWMRLIAAQNNLDTDTSHDAVYTDWESLDHFVEDFLTQMEKTSPQ